MKRLFLLMAALCLMPSSGHCQDVKARGDTLGINTVAAPVYFSNSFAYSDAANYATPWLDNWDWTNLYKDDAKGLDLPPGRYAQKTFFYGPEASSQIPKGVYVFKKTGDCDLEIAGKMYLSAPDRIEVELGPNPVGNGVKVVCYRSNPKNKLKNFSCFMPGMENNGSYWNDAFVRNVRGSAVIRTMQDTRTTEGLVATWADRGLPNNRPWSIHKDGVPVEASIELCKRAGSDLWINVPHLADDDFVRRQATLIKRLAPKGMRIYVELDNEVWNWGYEVARWQIGKWKEDSAPEDREFYGQSEWIAWRSAEIFDIWEDVFGVSDRYRFHEVMPGQAGWPARNGWLLSRLQYFRGGKVPCDDLAVGFYFYTNTEINTDNGVLIDLTADMEARKSAIFANLAKEIDSTFRIEARSNRSVADQFYVGLIGYEGGQHLRVVNNEGATQDQVDQSTETWIAVNRDARMEGIYRQHFKMCHEEGFQLLVRYNQMGAPSYNGSWGQQESLFSSIDDSPKVKAWLFYQFEASDPIRPTLTKPDVSQSRMMLKMPIAKPKAMPESVRRSMRIMGIPESADKVVPTNPGLIPATGRTMKKAG